MLRKYIKRPAAIRFRRYSHKGYAAFVSMHREVTIGTVASYIAERQLLKAKSAHSADVSVHRDEKLTDLLCGTQAEHDETVIDAAVALGLASSFVAEIPAAADFSDLESISKKTYEAVHGHRFMHRLFRYARCRTADAPIRRRTSSAAPRPLLLTKQSHTIPGLRRHGQCQPHVNQRKPLNPNRPLDFELILCLWRVDLYALSRRHSGLCQGKVRIKIPP
ncbi:MAG: hypothetical protein IAC51_07440 [bacterium]|uniref:Uncharacterized protein n=1 Tax=Candidatus Aphodosoma intestinipullorum TaxID=2840674 RepID=A0A940DM21_9BACT|nr:hypothetical protein [Candidatus Aphodosoma intestinipullorum]